MTGIPKRIIDRYLGQWNMQVAPLFFQDAAIGVDFFFNGTAGASAGAKAEPLLASLEQEGFFLSDPVGITPRSTYCNHTDPTWGSDKCWTVSGQFRPAHDAIRLDRSWAPSPWVQVEGAGALARPDIASRLTSRLLDTVYSVMDSRVKEEARPLPGVAYECWDAALMTPGTPKVSNYAMAEAYGWGSITTAMLLRNIVGFREVHTWRSPSSDEVAEFSLAPGLPQRLLYAGPCPRIFTLAHAHHRRRKLHITYTFSCAAATMTTASSVPLLVEVREHNDKDDSELKLLLSFTARNCGTHTGSRWVPGPLRWRSLPNPAPRRDSDSTRL